jgi:hypothetical protein
VKRLLFFTLLGIASAAQPSSKIEIIPVDDHGRRIEWDLKSFTSGDHNIANLFRDLKAVIPYGTYTYRIASRGWPERYVVGTLSLHLPEHVVVIPTDQAYQTGIAIDRTVPAGFVITGRISPAPEKDGRTRVHLSSTTGGACFDVKVDESGEFRVYEPVVGPYTLTLISGAEILHIQQVVFEQGLHSATFSIALPESRPAVIRVPSN